MWLWLVVGTVVGYLLLQLVRLLRADGDLQVLGSSLKPDYFKDRVVWVTGASSGSEWVCDCVCIGHSSDTFNKGWSLLWTM